MTYRVEPLRADHRLEGFDCGNPDLTEWLRLHGSPCDRTGHTDISLRRRAHRAVVGYFAIPPHILEREAAPLRIGRGAPGQIPAIWLAKLALDRSLHGRGLGSELLVKALETIHDVARKAGEKLVVVDAIDDASARFYRHHDFVEVPGNPMQLVMKLSTVAKALDLPWP